jgi:hypothetical protein
MSIWSTFNSLSVRGGGLSVTSANPVTPPGTLIPFNGLNNVSIPFTQNIAYDPATSLYVLPYSDATTVIPRVALSYDARSWYSNALPTTGSTDQRINVRTSLFANGFFSIPFAQQSPSVGNWYTSTNGTTWTKPTSGIFTLPGPIAKPLFDGTNTVYPVPSGLYYDSSPTTWTLKSVGTTGTPQRGYVSYQNGLYFHTTGINGTLPNLPTIRRSSTLTGTYTSLTIPSIFIANTTITTILYVAGVYYIFGGTNPSATTGTRIASTTDFSTYTTLYNGSIGTINDVLYDGTKFIMLMHTGDPGAGGYFRIYTTTDFITMSLRFDVSSRTAGSINYYNNEFIVTYLANSNINVATSPDGITWTQRL